MQLTVFKFITIELLLFRGFLISVWATIYNAVVVCFKTFDKFLEKKKCELQVILYKNVRFRIILNNRGQILQLR